MRHRSNTWPKPRSSIAGALFALVALGATVLTPAPLFAAAVDLSAHPHILSDEIEPGQSLMRYRHLGALRITPGEASPAAVVGWSELVWDADEERLYALSDRGWLVHLSPILTDGLLTGLDAHAAFRLRGPSQALLKGTYADSEGLAGTDMANGVRGDTRLFVSFERFPRVYEYTPQGRFVRNVPLPERLRKVEAYASPNRGLEALALHPKLGLVVGSEAPMPAYAATLAAIDPSFGGVSVPLVPLGRAAAPIVYRLFDTPNSSLVAMRAHADGSMVFLERGYGWLYRPVTVTLKRLEALSTDRPAPGTPETLFHLDSAQGWHLDNIEGLAHHQGQRYFMVSDDNNSALQSTLLIYFEVVPLPGARAVPARDRRPRATAIRNTSAASQPMTPSNWPTIH